MSTLLQMSTCPNCGAPHHVAASAQRLLCIYCNVSLGVQRSATGVAALTPAQDVSKEDIERIKQLLIDGKKDEAIAFYKTTAKVDQAEAERVVGEVFLDAYWTLVRHLPIKTWGFFLYIGVIVACALVAAWAAGQAMTSPAYWLLVVFALLFAIGPILAFVRHGKSTWTASFGARGRGRVLRLVNMRTMEVDGFLVVAQFEVTPDDGRPVFIDQETLFVGGATLAKLAVGNTLAVRFDAACEHVFLSTPVTVL